MNAEIERKKGLAEQLTAPATSQEINKHKPLAPAGNPAMAFEARLKNKERVSGGDLTFSAEGRLAAAPARRQFRQRAKN